MENDDIESITSLNSIESDISDNIIEIKNEDEKIEDECDMLKNSFKKVINYTIFLNENIFHIDIQDIYISLESLINEILENAHLSYYEIIICLLNKSSSLIFDIVIKSLHMKNFIKLNKQIIENNCVNPYGINTYFFN